MTQKQFVFSLNIPFQVLLRKFENIEGPGSRECAVCIWMGGAVGVGCGGGGAMGASRWPRNSRYKSN